MRSTLVETARILWSGFRGSGPQSLVGRGAVVLFSGAQLDLVLSFSQAITLHLWISWPSSFASISAHAQGSRKGPLVVHHSVQVAQLAFLCTVSSQVGRSLCSDELFFFAGQPVCNLLRDPIYSARTNPAFPRHPPCPSQSGEAVIWEAIVWEATVWEAVVREAIVREAIAWKAVVREAIVWRQQSGRQ